MNTDTDRSRLQAAGRFGQMSKSMFFARHVPQPKYLKFITGEMNRIFSYGKRKKNFFAIKERPAFEFAMFAIMCRIYLLLQQAI